MREKCLSSPYKPGPYTLLDVKEGGTSMGGNSQARRLRQNSSSSGRSKGGGAGEMGTETWVSKRRKGGEMMKREE